MAIVGLLRELLQKTLGTESIPYYILSISKNKQEGLAVNTARWIDDMSRRGALKHVIFC